MTLSATRLGQQSTTGGSSCACVCSAPASGGRLVCVVGTEQYPTTTITVTAVSGLGATWARRSQNAFTQRETVEVWYADIPSAQAGGTVTATLSGTQDDGAMIVFLVSSSTSAAIAWDGNASVPKLLQGATGSATISTTSSAPYVMTFVGSPSNTVIGSGSLVPSGWSWAQVGSVLNGGGSNFQYLYVYGALPGAAVASTTVGTTAAAASTSTSIDALTEISGVSATGTGAISFAGSGTASLAITGTGTGAISFAGSGTATLSVNGTGTGAITFAGSGTAGVITPLAGTGALLFQGAGIAHASTVGSGAISFAGSGAAFVGSNPATGTGALDFEGWADADVAPHLDTYAPPEWSWVLVTPTGSPITSLTAATARKLTWRLNGAAVAQFTMPGEHPQTAGVLELATDVLVARNGRPLFRGRVTASTEQHNATADSVNFTATDYRGMLDHRLLWPEMTLGFAAVDQADIAWSLVAGSQAMPNGDLGITRGVGRATGVLRDRQYTAGNTLAQSMSELADIAHGFDWEVDTSLRFNLFYPQRGRASGLVLAYGRDVTDVQTQVNPAAYANAVYFTGSTPATTPVEATATPPAGVGRWDIQKADPNVVLQATLQDEANEELAQDERVISSIQVTLAADVWNPYTLWLGDSVRAVVQAGRLNIDVTERVVQVDVTLSDDGVETVALDIGAAPPKLSDRLASLQTQITKLQLAPGIGNLPVNYGLPGSFGSGGPPGSGGGPIPGGGGGGGIQEITSNDGSITVTNPFGPVTNLVVAATGALIIVTNPAGPVVDLSLGGGGVETVTISYPSLPLVYYKTAPPGWAFTYSLSFDGAPNEWLETVTAYPDYVGGTPPQPDIVSLITQPGTYQMTFSAIVDSPLTHGDPGGATQLQFSAGPGVGAGYLDPYTLGYVKTETGLPVSIDATAIAAGVTAGMFLLTTSLDTTDAITSDECLVTVNMSLTRTPP